MLRAMQGFLTNPQLNQQTLEQGRGGRGTLESPRNRGGSLNPSLFDPGESRLFDALAAEGKQVVPSPSGLVSVFAPTPEEFQQLDSVAEGQKEAARRFETQGALQFSPKPASTRVLFDETGVPRQNPAGPFGPEDPTRQSAPTFAGDDVDTRPTEPFDKDPAVDDSLKKGVASGLINNLGNFISDPNGPIGLAGREFMNLAIALNRMLSGGAANPEPVPTSSPKAPEAPGDPGASLIEQNKTLIQDNQNFMNPQGQNYSLTPFGLARRSADLLTNSPAQNLFKVFQSLK